MLADLFALIRILAPLGGLRPPSMPRVRHKEDSLGRGWIWRLELMARRSRYRLQALRISEVQRQVNGKPETFSIVK